MNPFKSQGFDSLIAKGLVINGTMILARGSTTQIDGTMTGYSIEVENTSAIKGTDNTTLVINGAASTIDSIVVTNVTITGQVTCDVLDVSGILAIKKGARVDAKIIRYNTLVVETGAMVNGNFQHISSSDLDVMA